MSVLRFTKYLTFCVVLATASAATAQTPQPKLEVLSRQGDYYWVVETAPDGSRKGGWVSVQVPLGAIDRNALKPIPALSAPASTEQGPPDGASVNERLAKIEQALAVGQSAGPDVSAQQVNSVRSAPLRQVTRPQVAQPRFSVDGNAVHTGTVELMALGDFSSTSVAGESVNALNVNTLNLTAFVGVFATPKVEVGVSASVLKLDILNTSNTSGHVMGHVFFNFPNQSAIVPFIGIGLGTTFGYADDFGHPATLDVSGGFRVMMPGGGGALVIRPFYNRLNLSNAFVNLNVNSFGVAVGASLLF